MWLHPGAVSYLAAWIEVRGTHPGALFDHADHKGRHLSPDAVRLRLAKLQGAAGISHFTPHDLRRTFVTTCLRAHHDPFEVARLVGHKNVATTMMYDLRTDLEGRAIVDAMRMPGSGAVR